MHENVIQSNPEKMTDKMANKDQPVDLELKCARPDGDTPTLGWATFVVS